ncbi:39S ribosomal protein L21, mitochondrial [Cololabis saira]|uniref:39S ribosomal protein L21, mitochondrial n=1 Tax=Cololabis saira TaxID=129043 RepID=UPI002AD488AF|nr:39S ribosomal protein L21, mitochondrial [Cololabis saira]
MAATRAAGVWGTCRFLLRGNPLLVPGTARTRSSVSGDLLPRTSLSRPPWSRPAVLVPEDEQRRNAAVLAAVERLVRGPDLGRLFAVVHLASRQWKVTAEDLVLLENHLQADCGERILLEKVLLLGARDFTLLGRPLLARELVRVEATVLEKTESWPKVHMRFWKRHRYQRQRTVVQPQTVLRINSIEVAPGLC